MTEQPFDSRVRFTLSTLLLWMTIAGLFFALVRLTIDVELQREKVRMLQTELRVFHIDEPDKIHAARLESFDDLFYKFRVYLPEGKKYTFNYSHSEIPRERPFAKMPATGMPTPIHSVSVKSGGYLVYLHKDSPLDPMTGFPLRQATMKVNIEPIEGQKKSSSSTAIGVSGDWLFNEEVQQPCGSVTSIGTVQTFGADQAAVLIRFRETSVSNIERGPQGHVLTFKNDIIEEPCDGFMIWIEEEKPATPED